MARAREDRDQRVPAGPDVAAGQKMLYEQSEKFFFGEGAQLPPDTSAAGQVAAAQPGRSCAAGRLLLVSCYELGHQPLGVASAARFLARAGFAPSSLDLAVEPLDDAARARLAAARLVAISVPMHTALRLGLRVAARVRAREPGRPRLLLRAVRDAERARSSPRRRTPCSGGDCEARWSRWRRRSRRAPAPSRGAAGRRSACRRWCPIARALPALARYAQLAIATASARSPGTSRRAAAASTCAGTARSRRSTAAASSRSPVETSCSPTSRRRSRPARAHHLRRSRFLQRAAHALARRARAARGASRRDLRLHGQGRAPRSRSDALSRSSRRSAALFVVSARSESLSTIACSRSRQGPHARRRLEALALIRAAGSRCGRPASRSRRGRRSTTTASSARLRRTTDARRSRRSGAALDPPAGAAGLAAARRPRTCAPFLGARRRRFTYRWTHPDPRMDAPRR